MRDGTASGTEPAVQRASPPDPADVAFIVRSLGQIRERIARACDRAGRDPSAVDLIGVSKTVPPERLRAAVLAGVTVLGENRVQEALAKVGAVPGATWHLIGPLQSNKARHAIQAFAVIESVGSLDLAIRLDRLVAEDLPGRALPVLLQVNVDDDPAKAGFGETALAGALPKVLELRGLSVVGLMTVGRLTATPEAARSTFSALGRLSERLRERHPRLGPELSMGMSDDFEIAIEEGATIVRIGRALFGARPAVAV